LIDDGLDEAYAFVGAIYEFGGKDVKIDYEKARFYYEKSIEKFGAVESYLGLARIYFYGLGVEKDYCKAFELYQVLSEDNDNMFANYMLGKMYVEGLCVDQNYILAKEFFNKSWNKGYVFSLTQIAALEKVLGNRFKSWILRAKAGLKAFFIERKNINDPRVSRIPVEIKREIKGQST